MFGWEFPPHISGGLGTACYGLTKGLHSVGVNDILFVVPKAYGDEDTSKVNIIDAGEIVVSDRIIDYKPFFTADALRWKRSQTLFHTRRI